MPIHGRVLNERNNEWIKNAHVEVHKPNDPPNNLLGFKTPLVEWGITGCYFAYGPNGIYEIKASAAGYQDKIEQVHVSRALATHDIILSPTD